MRRLRFLGSSLDTDAKAERGVHEFAEMVGSIINATVSKAPITYVEAGGPRTWYVAHVQDKIPAPLPLTNGHYLFLYNLLGLRRKERYLATLEYRYTYQATTRDDSWILRYEYVREPPEPYPYAKQHVHVNATPDAYGGAESFPGLHLPTGRRITIELLVRHLIAEHGLVPISDKWETTIQEAEAHFRDVQEKRAKNPALPVDKVGSDA
jgi:hypothetical protein